MICKLTNSTTVSGNCVVNLASSRPDKESWETLTGCCCSNRVERGSLSAVWQSSRPLNKTDLPAHSLKDPADGWVPCQYPEEHQKERGFQSTLQG